LAQAVIRKFYYRYSTLSSADAISYPRLVVGCLAVALPIAMASFSLRAETLDYCHKGAIAAQKGDLEVAIERFSKCINGGELTSASMATALYNRGTAHQKIGEFDRAIQDYDKALGLNPNHVPSLYNRATVHEETGDYEGAIADYGGVIRQDPAHRYARVNRGNSHQKLGQYDLAIQDYNEVIRRFPRFAIAYYNRANAHHRMGHNAEAIRDFDEAIRLDPSYAQAYYARGVVHYRGGEMEPAFRDYNRAVSLDPGYKARPYSQERLAVQTSAPDSPQASSGLEVTADKVRGGEGQAFALHFSSVRDEDVARAEWSRLQAAFPDLLGDRKLLIRSVDIEGQGRFFRILTGSFPEHLQAHALCQKFDPQEQYCAVIPLKEAP
jgi:tetratricopeptide (TPR) repeat protein